MLLEAYSNDAWCQTVTSEWFKRFKNGKTLMDDSKLSDRPSTSGSKPLIAQVKNFICGYRRLTARKVAEEVGVSTGSCHSILMEDLGMHWVFAKFVTRLWTDDQKLQHFTSEKISAKEQMMTKIF
jgi:hypothetical protein